MIHKFTKYSLGIIIILVLSTVGVFGLESLSNVEITTNANPITGETVIVPEINSPIEIEKVEWLDNCNNVLNEEKVFRTEQEYKLKIYYKSNEQIASTTFKKSPPLPRLHICLIAELDM